MRQSFENIEYRRFPGHGYLVGYSRTGYVYHIHRSGRGWLAQSTRPGMLGVFHASTLAEVSAQLSSR